MSDVIVETRSGLLRGVSTGGVQAFTGIPYGAPPVGERRFRAPEPVRPWTGVRDAVALPPSCPQVVDRPPAWPQEPAESEDCLAVNVWTPATGDGRRRPVMVWFHGGGYHLGSASWPHYDGAALARRGDVVVVGVNHRLGILGYLHLGDLVDDDRYAASGNAGLLDLVLALEWVRDNIETFGGDPAAVTIFGESGGGSKVSMMLAMPRARGLFHRAAVQSGPGLWAQDPADATAAATEALDAAGLLPARLNELQSVPVERLLEQQSVAARKYGLLGRRGFRPVVDGTVLPMHPAEAVELGVAPDIPMIIGSTRDEATVFLAGDPASWSLDPATLRRRVAGLSPDADALVAAYEAARPDARTAELLIAIYSDHLTRLPSIQLAELRLAAGRAPVYMYLFCWASGPLGAAHGFDLPFVFDNARLPVLAPSATRTELAARMSGAWLSFARTGDPRHAGLPSWPRYSLGGRTTMIFDRGTCRPVNDPYGAERQAWRRAPSVTAAS